MHSPAPPRLQTKPQSMVESQPLHSDRMVYEALVQSIQRVSEAFAAGADITPATVLTLARGTSRIQAGLPPREIRLLRESFDTLLLMIAERQTVTHTALGPTGPRRPAHRINRAA